MNTHSDVAAEALNGCSVGGGGEGTWAVVDRGAVGAFGARAGVSERHWVSAERSETDGQFQIPSSGYACTTRTRHGDLQRG